MKKLRYALYAAILLCVVVTAVFLVIMPDTVPAHYNLAGEADRFGSKYENLLWPVTAAAMGGLFLLMSKFQWKGNGAVLEKVMLYTGIFLVIFFTAMGVYFMIQALRYDPAAAPNVSSDGIMRFTSIATGVLLIVIGNIMPKARKNILFGLRTKWSLANDHVWQRSQRFGGASAVVCGLCLIAVAVFVSGVWQILLMSGLVVLWLAVCIAATYRFFMEDAQKGGHARER